MKFKFLCYFLGLSVSVSAQVNVPKETPPPIEPKVEKPTEQIFTIAESMPPFSNGEKGLYKYIQENLRYPTLARQNGIEGTVYLDFWVDQKGSVFDITVRRGIKDGCTEEAIRLLKSVPQGILVRSDKRIPKLRFTVPVKFKLD